MTNLVKIGLILACLIQLPAAKAAEHIRCQNTDASLQAMMVFFGDLSEGNGFVQLAEEGHFLDSSHPDARVFSKFSTIGGGIKVLSSLRQPETLVISSDLKQVIVFGKAGQLENILGCHL